MTRIWVDGVLPELVPLFSFLCIYLEFPNIFSVFECFCSFSFIFSFLGDVGVRSFLINYLWLAAFQIQSHKHDFLPSPSFVLEIRESFGNGDFGPSSVVILLVLFGESYNVTLIRALASKSREGALQCLQLEYLYIEVLYFHGISSARYWPSMGYNYYVNG